MTRRRSNPRPAGPLPREGFVFCSADELREQVERARHIRAIVQSRKTCPFCVTGAPQLHIELSAGGYLAGVLCTTCRAAGPPASELDPLMALLRALDLWNAAPRSAKPVEMEKP